MLKNYITSLWRYVSKNKGFTIINVSGLAIGMLACMLISQFVIHELSYDDFLDKKDRIYRLQLDRYNKGQVETRWAAGAAGIGTDLKANFPEVERMVRITRRPATLSRGDAFFKEENLVFASPDFFKVFSIRLIEGVDSLVLKEPFQTVLSQAAAKKYFGNENPVGKTLISNGKREYLVTGVFEDLPVSTHMQMDVISSFGSLQKVWNNEMTTWYWDGFFTYILLDKKADLKAFTAKMNDFVFKHETQGGKKESDMVFNLQPINAIHLDSDFMLEFKPNGNRQTVNFLSVVAVLIILIAWINYINLSTAKSVERAREVGVRKVMGGYRSQLVQQFLTESLFLNVLAVGLAVIFAFLLTPWFSSLTGRDLGYVLFRQPMFWGTLASLIIGGAIISGLYPAFILSAFRPVEVLKGKFRNSSQGVWLRKGMVITQFVASITLMVGTFTVYRQISYMRNQTLGVNIDQTVILQSPSVIDSTYEEKFQVFKQRVSQFSEVAYVSASSSVPGAQPGWNAGGIRLLRESEDESKQYRVIEMEESFIPAYGLKVLTGREFSGSVPNERKNVMMNESATRVMGFSKIEEAIDEQIYFWGDTFKIVGVLKDYRQESLKKSFEPLIFRYSRSPGGFYSIKFNTSNVKKSMDEFETVWKEIFPGNTYIYFFLDAHYNKQYQADQQFGNVFGIFSALAIFIACLGLFGLASLTALQRTKEIGIRKVLGASLFGILRLMSREFVVLILVAIFVSVPLSVWVINDWLESFANRIELSWWLFAVPSFAVIFIALLTVSVHTLKAAMSDPVKSLRYE